MQVIVLLCAIWLVALPGSDSAAAAAGPDWRPALAAGDFAVAAERLLAAAKAGEAAAQFEMALLYDAGRGVGQDVAAAAR